MKYCQQCGRKIEYGVNGAMLLPRCFDCMGGPPRYPDPVIITRPRCTPGGLDKLEDRCLNMGDTDID